MQIYVNYQKPLHFLVMMILVVGGLGCTALVDMDRPIPPKKLLWKKVGIGLDETSKELTDCAQQAIHGGAVSVEEVGYESDICMLKKGFKFVPNAEGYRNICVMNSFRNTPSCRSTRGAYSE